MHAELGVPFGHRREARPRNAREAHRGGRFHRRGAGRDADQRKLAEVVAGPERTELERSAPLHGAAVQDDVRVLAVLALVHHDGPRRQRDLVERVDEDA